MSGNPLSAPRAKPRAEHPVMQHAKVWQHIGQMDPTEQMNKTAELSHTVPILGALASNPDVTRKDVIKAAADAAGAGKVPPSQAVSFITAMPDDPEKLQPWLKQLYQTNLTALVHLKATQAAPPQPVAPPQPAPVAPPQVAPQ